MEEPLKALQFYRLMNAALKTTGINRVILTMGADGEIEANVDMGEKDE